MHSVLVPAQSVNTPLEHWLEAVPPGNGRRVVVGLSGGVDSSVSAWVLKECGWDVLGLFMKNWEDDDHADYCSTREDLIDAASAADCAGVPLEAVNFSAEYKDRVFAEFLREYEAGHTPNPDILCNAEIKFRAFLDHAIALGAERIATGHYAQVRFSAPTRPTMRADALHGGSGADGGSRADGGGGRWQLLRGLDAAKDQSYFLHRLSQDQLSKTLFPVGHLPKSIVREIARTIKLPNAAKKDSTGICFIGERPFREFLGRYLAHRPGPIRDPSGRVLGEHVGLSFYTLGQRKGIGVGGSRSGNGDAWYVARKDLTTNTLWIVQGHDHPWLLSCGLTATDAHWIEGYPPSDLSGLTARMRYRQQDAPCTFHRLGHATGPAASSAESSAESVGDGFALEFPDPQWAVTPGQYAVLYRAEVCLGGGVIASANS
jgi:tRNA-specific 2-thiouridylase